STRASSILGRRSGERRTPRRRTSRTEPRRSSVPDESFMKSLFYGVVAESLVFPFPEPGRAEVDNLNLILDSVRRFCAQNVDPVKIGHEHAIGPEVLAGLKELGLFGMSIPQEFGGIGLSTTGYARVMEEIAGIDGSLAVTLGGHQSIGLKAILLFGTDDQ